MGCPGQAYLLGDGPVQDREEVEEYVDARAEQMKRSRFITCTLQRWSEQRCSEGLSAGISMTGVLLEGAKPT